MYISILLSFMVLSAVVTATLKLFTCEDFRPSGGPYVLVDDMSVECGTRLHSLYRMFGVIMMLSPVGGAFKSRTSLFDSPKRWHIQLVKVLPFTNLPMDVDQTTKYLM